MRETILGRSGLRVSRVAFGTWQLGGEWGPTDEERAIWAIRRAAERGVTLFDTAQAYGFGAAERLLAKALSGLPRDEVVIATKGGLRPARGGVVRDSSPAWIRRGVEESLAALETDYLDLYQVHWPDTETPFEATAGALAELVAEGKVRHVGVSNFDADQVAAFDAILAVETLQPPYHLFRRAAEATILPYTRAHDIGVLVYGPLAHGLLGGQLGPDTRFEAGDWRATSDVFVGDAYRTNLAVVSELERLAAEELGATIGELAVAWTLANPDVDVAIVGTRDPAHVEEAVDAVDLELGDDLLARIDEVMAGAVPVSGPAPEAMPGR